MLICVCSLQSPPALRATQPVPVSSSSSSPPYLPSPTLHVATTNQNQIMSMDDEDFSTDDEHAVSRTLDRVYLCLVCLTAFVSVI